MAGFGSAPARGPVTPATGDPGDAATSRRLRSVGRTAATNRRSSAELVAAYLYAQLDELRARESAARIDSPETENRMRRPRGDCAAAWQRSDPCSQVHRHNICAMSSCGSSLCSDRFAMWR